MKIKISYYFWKDWAACRSGFLPAREKLLSTRGWFAFVLCRFCVRWRLVLGLSRMPVAFLVWSVADAYLVSEIRTLTPKSELVTGYDDEETRGKVRW